MTNEELLNCLKDRPCSACKFREEEGCTQWDCVFDGALKQKQKPNVALERYKDLQNYFGDENIAKTVLESQKEFKGWLERLRWNTKKVDELARKLEGLEQEHKIGHWIYNNGSYKCQFCRHEITGIEEDLNFCCKCGARMEIEDEPKK